MRRRTASVLAITVVLLAAAGFLLLPKPLPLCCGGDGQVSRSAKVLALRASSGAMVVWDAWKSRVWTVPAPDIRSADAAGKGNAVVFVIPGAVMLGDMHTGAVAPLQEATGLAPATAMISDDARFVAVAGADAEGNGVWLIDREHHDAVLVSLLPDGARASDAQLLALSADGRFVAFAAEGNVFAFDVFRGRARRIWRPGA